MSTMTQESHARDAKFRLLRLVGHLLDLRKAVPNITLSRFAADLEEPIISCARMHDVSASRMLAMIVDVADGKIKVL